jgi:hypothetical protein
MQPIPRSLADQFASQFAGNRVGFSAKEISGYFSKYSNLVKPFDHYGFNPTRKDLFIESLYALTPSQQYYALNDLTCFEQDCRYDYPAVDVLNELRTRLHSFICTEPIGLGISRIRMTAYREDWMTAYSRINSNPGGAITAARTMLETALKTIISERGSEHDTSGDLGRLLRQAEDAIGFSRNDRQPEHQILLGLANVCNGLATLSNSAGDRHGLVEGLSIDDPAVAGLCVNAAGVLTLAMLDLHLLSHAGKVNDA